MPRMAGIGLKRRTPDGTDYELPEEPVQNYMAQHPSGLHISRLGHVECKNPISHPQFTPSVHSTNVYVLYVHSPKILATAAKWYVMHGMCALSYLTYSCDVATE